MDTSGNAFRLRFYISSTDKAGHEPLSEYLVNKAHKDGLAGATVLKGIIGFGASSVIHSYKFWEISDKVPIVVEIIDDENALLNYYTSLGELLQSMRYGCMVTLEPTRILLYKAGTRQQH